MEIWTSFSALMIIWMPHELKEMTWLWNLSCHAEFCIQTKHSFQINFQRNSKFKSMCTRSDAASVKMITAIEAKVSSLKSSSLKLSFEIQFPLSFIYYTTWKHKSWILFLSLKFQRNLRNFAIACWPVLLGWKLSPVVFYHWLKLRNTTWLSFQPQDLQRLIVEQRRSDLMHVIDIRSLRMYFIIRAKNSLMFPIKAG